MDSKFAPQKEINQKKLRGFCRDLRKSTWFMAGTEDCWIEKFDDWLRDQYSLKIPLNEDEFMKYLIEYTDEENGDKRGIRYLKDRDIGIVNETLVFSRFTCTVNVTERTVGALK